ncbi:LysR substrate-binding domain-containing protein [Rhodovibrionaceae bacterium A322]
MKDLPLTWLRALAAVYDTGGIRPAGRQLAVTHSAISRHLRDLEAWLETPLFDKRPGSQNLVFTAEGEKLAQGVLQNFTDVALLVEQLREGRRSNAVTLATTASVASRWLLPRLAAFEAENSWIELSLVIDQRPRDPQEEGADLSLRMGKGPGPKGPGKRKAEATAPLAFPLMDDTLFPVMSRAFWQEAGRPDQPEDLQSLRLLHDRDPHAAWSQWKQQFGPEELNVRSGPRFTSSDLVLRAAEQGLGVALARGHLAHDALASGHLIRPFGDLSVPLPDAYWLLQNPATASRPAVRTTKAWLLAETETEKEENQPDKRVQTT